jgi:hypothetical protein
MEEPDLAGRRSTSSARSQSRRNLEDEDSTTGVAPSRTSESRQRGFRVWALGRRGRAAAICVRCLKIRKTERSPTPPRAYLSVTGPWPEPEGTGPYTVEAIATNDGHVESPRGDLSLAGVRGVHSSVRVPAEHVDTRRSTTASRVGSRLTSYRPAASRHGDSSIPKISIISK